MTLQVSENHLEFKFVLCVVQTTYVKTMGNRLAHLRQTCDLWASFSKIPFGAVLGFQKRWWLVSIKKILFDSCCMLSSGKSAPWSCCKQWGVLSRARKCWVRISGGLNLCDCPCVAYVCKMCGEYSVLSLSNWGSHLHSRSSEHRSWRDAANLLSLAFPSCGFCNWRQLWICSNWCWGLWWYKTSLPKATSGF